MSAIGIKERVSGYLDQPPTTNKVLTKFLTLSEQAVVNNMLKNRIPYQLFGGYTGAEKKRLAMFDQDDFQITCFQISKNDKFVDLTHQNILGTLMSLSISIDSIGDIIAEDGIFFVISDLEAFIIQEFTHINHVPLTLEIIRDVKLDRVARFDEKSCSVSSLRLDAVISKITNLSREESSVLIQNDLVKINHLVVNKNIKLVTENDVISIRKYGRFQIFDTSKKSKKGKIILKYGKYL
ncbi:MAG: hypothetical protein JXR62_01700 [Bacilli bacterium]|nr:hypothetical protein [Bacilli bacterium]